MSTEKTLLAGRVKGRHRGKFHIKSAMNIGGSLHAECAVTLRLEDFKSASDVPVGRRCKKQGCAQLWPAYMRVAAE